MVHGGARLSPGATLRVIITKQLPSSILCNDFVEISRKHTMETISVVIQPIDSQSCRVFCTLAHMAEGVFNRVILAACYCSFLKALEKHAHAQFQCFSDEAVRRRNRLPERMHSKEVNQSVHKRYNRFMKRMT